MTGGIGGAADLDVNCYLTELLARFQVQESRADLMKWIACEDWRNNTPFGAPFEQRCEFVWTTEG